MKKIILLIIVILLIPLVFSYGNYNNQGEEEIKEDDITIPDNFGDLEWYHIEDWEFKFCSQFGGYENVDSSSVGGNSPQVSQLTITLQAQKRTQPDNTIIYEISYYIQPLKNNSKYAIKLAKGDERLDVLEPTDVTTEGDADYLVIESEQDFDEVKMKFIGPDGSGIMTSPITDAELGYTQNSSKSAGYVPGATGEDNFETDW